MQTVVLIIMILIAFNFMLKQSFHKIYFVAPVAIIAALFVGLMWPIAILQSKSQIAAWLENPDLMLDTSVILTIEVALQMAFCLMAAKKITVGIEKKIERLIYYLLWFFPGFLIFAVLFSLLVVFIFRFPGISFPLLAWILATVVFIAIPAVIWLLGKLLPEQDIRLELLFLTNALLAVLGIVATVNGRTAVDGINEFNWQSLLMLVILLLNGGIVGFLLRRRRIINLNNKN